MTIGGIISVGFSFYAVGMTTLHLGGTMSITKDTIIKPLESLINEWISAKRSLLEHAYYTDYITRDFFFNITTFPKSIGEYVIDAIDKELLSFDQNFIINRVYPEIIEIVLTHHGYTPTRSPYTGVDFGFTRGGKLHLMAMETPDSGQWGFEDIFGEIRHVIGLNFVPVVGSYYGSTTYSDNEAFLYFSGRRFWSLVSGDEFFSSTLIGVMEEICRTVRQEFSDTYGSAVNRMVRDVTLNFCDEEGVILWEKIAHSDLPPYANYAY
jgi:hypothetical protein